MALDSYTKLLIHFNDSGTPATCETGQSLTYSGHATNSTSQVKFGARALALDGTDDYITVANSSGLPPGTGAFTIDAWLYCATSMNDSFIFGFRNAWTTLVITTGGYDSTTVGSLRYGGSSTFTTGSTVIPTGQWAHIAAVRDGSNNVKLYINGTEYGSGTDTTNYTQTSGNIVIGKNDMGSVGYFNGYMDEIRISTGIARWTSNFTPPSGEYGNWPHKLYGISYPGKVYGIAGSSIAKIMGV